MGGDVERAQQRAIAVELDVAAHPDRMAPGALDATGRRELGGEPAEPLVPLVAPDLQIDVDDVVVGDRHPAQPVADRERPRLARGRGSARRS